MSIIREPAATRREPKCVELRADLCVVGGGLAGVCCAVTAARAGAKVVLMQDRPVLGGNCSSEVRLWILGATSHMHNNNRWAREGGVINEILVENLHRNPEGNPCIVDTILLEKAVEESNITLLLNTAAHDVEKPTSPEGADRISAVRGFCSQNSTLYHVEARTFCDASGDGIVGFLSGAAFRMGAEPPEEFGEKFAPDTAYGHLLGHSIYFYSKDTDKPVQFIPPSFALKNVPERIPRFRQFSTGTMGCRLWWIEYGGRMDTVHDTETIKWELWKIVYGVWDYIKNSGQFPDAANLTLEWVGTIPGKRESRRFEGDTMLTQNDVITQRRFDDCVSFGGWSLDLHPADGVFSERQGCDQYHPKGAFGIPYRCMYSRNIDNLFLAGRIISASHVAFGSTRVMATCAHGGQAVGMAAAMCAERNLLPRDLSGGEALAELQRRLMRTTQYLPDFVRTDAGDLAQQATVGATSELRLSQLPIGEGTWLCDRDRAQMLPVSPGKTPHLTAWLDVSKDTPVELQLRLSGKARNHTPDVIAATKRVGVQAGRRVPVTFDFNVAIDAPRWAFYCVMANADVSVHLSDQRATGLLPVSHRYDQKPDRDIGVDSFEVWPAERRPNGRNFAFQLDQPVAAFAAANVIDGIGRPTDHPHAWVAAPGDRSPALTLKWNTPRRIRTVELVFDCDFDHPMESVLWGQPERDMPFCVKHYRVKIGPPASAGGECLLHECTDNHQTLNTITLAEPVTTDTLTIECVSSHSDAPAAIFEVRCYA
ncbi:MAG: FAD-dependent oxidoreductase [Phycisphaerales bacterium]